MCEAVASGAPKLRDGPMRVAKLTRRRFAFLSCEFWLNELFAVVGVYQVRPWSTKSGARSQTSVPYGSNAFGQPFQPSSVKVLSVAPDHVCHVFRRSGCAQSVPPSRMLTVVPSPAKPWFQASANLCVFASRTSSCFSWSKLPPRGGGRGRVRHFLLPQVVHGRL